MEDGSTELWGSLAPSMATVSALRAPRRTIGRELDLARLRALLAAHRLVTIAGPAGVGKTTLALAMRAELSNDGAAVVTIDARSVSGSQDLAVAAAAGLGLVLGFSRNPEHAIALVGHVLAVRAPDLVLIDNLEQALPSAAAPLAAWLEQAPSTRFVVTSRRRIEIVDETLFDLEPLPCGPDPSTPGPAVELLVERARAVGASWSDQDERARRSLYGIAKRLEGLPLALELAAARMDVLHPDQVLKRLEDDPLELLSTSDRAGPGRTRGDSMREALDRSFAVLDEKERAALVECTVFAGGFSIEAAEQVLTGAAGTDIVELLSSLRGKSLLRASGARLSLLEAVRRHARERDASTVEAAAARHAAYFSKLCASHAKAFRGTGSRDELDAIRSDRDNAVAALDHLIDSGELAAACDLLVALDAVDRIDAPPSTTIARCARLLSSFGAAPSEGASLARVHLVAAAAHRRAGRLDEAKTHVEQAQTGAGADAGLAVEVQLEAAQNAATRGTLSEALALLEGAVDGARRAGEDLLFAEALARFGSLLEVRYHRTPAALDTLEQAVRVAKRAGHALILNDCLARLGVALYRTGDRPSGYAYLVDAQARWQAVGDDREAAICAQHLASIDHVEGRLDEARARLDASLAVHRRLGHRDLEAGALLGAALLDLEQGAFETARTRAQQAFDVLSGHAHEPGNALLRGVHAAASAWLGRDAESDRSAVLAKQAASESDPLAHAIEVLGLHRTMARAKQADDTAATTAQRRLRSLRGDDAHELKLAARTVEAALARLLPPEGALVVDREISWVQPPGAEPVELRKKPVLRRLLTHLVDARRTHPGKSSTIDTLIAVGWQGESIRYESAKNRLHVAMTSLRNLGLRSILQSGPEGFRLDPEVPIWTR